MSRINVVNRETAGIEQQQLFDSIQSQLGMVPNFLKVLANSPEALKAFLGLHSISGQGKLEPQTRERIALALAQQNTCEYCVSAHTAIGRKAGLSNSEIEAKKAFGKDRTIVVRPTYMMGPADRTDRFTYWQCSGCCSGN